MKTVSTIKINEKDLKIGEIIKKGAEAPFEELVSVKAIIDDQVSQLKALQDKVDSWIENANLSEIMKTWIAEGKAFEGDQVYIQVETKLGETMSVTPKEKESKTFSVGELSKDAIFKSIVSERYKKTTVGLDKKAVEDDYDNGTLPEEMKAYCSKTLVKKVALSKDTRKTKD